MFPTVSDPQGFVVSASRRVVVARKLTLLALLAGLAQFPMAGCGGGRLEFGEPVDETAARDVAEVLRDTQSVAGASVVVRGRISEVCASAGCWFVLQATESGKVYDLFVDLKGGADFTVPVSIRGRSAVVSGKLVGERPDLKLNARGLVVE